MFGSSKGASDDAPANPTAASARSAAEAKLAALKEKSSLTSSSAPALGESAPAAAPSGGNAAAAQAGAGSGAIGVVKSLLGSIKGADDDEKDDSQNPFMKKKKPDVAIIDPEAYYAGSRPAMALGYGATGGDTLKPDATSPSTAIKKNIRRGRKNAAPANTMNMNLAPRRNSVYIQRKQGNPMEGLRIPPNRDQPDADAHTQEEFDESSLSSGSVSLKLAVPVQSSNGHAIWKSWKKIFIILLLLATVISISFVAVLQGWVGAAPETLTAKSVASSGARKTKEFHTQYEWPRNGQDKDEAYANMIHDRSVLAHNAQTLAGSSNQEGPSSSHQLGLAYEQPGDGPWRVGYRDGLGGIAKQPPDSPSQKYILMYQQEQQQRAEQEEQDEHEHPLTNIQQDQFYRRTMQQPLGGTNQVVMVDKVIPQPVNLP